MPQRSWFRFQSRRIAVCRLLERRDPRGSQARLLRRVHSPPWFLTVDAALVSTSGDLGRAVGDRRLKPVHLVSELPVKASRPRSSGLQAATNAICLPSPGQMIVLSGLLA